MTPYTAQDMFELVDDLRRHVEEAYENQKWANDAQFARSYEQLATIAANALPSDPVIGLLQVSIPQELDAMISQDASCLTAWVRMQTGRLAIRLSQLARSEAPPGSMIDLDLSFMQDHVLREIVASDFIEAQRSYYGNAAKAAALLCGSALEGMLLDVLQQADAENHGAYQALLDARKIKTLDWDRASLAQLLDLAYGLGRLHASTHVLGGGALEFRDTIHPKAEQRKGIRARTQEANVLMSMVGLVAADLRTAS